MLSNVQSEVDGLKTELGDEDRIRSEVEELLAEEKRRTLKSKKWRQVPWISCYLMVGSLPHLQLFGLLLGLIIVYC